MRAFDCLAAATRVIAGVRVERNLMASPGVRIYFANHSSHLDFVVIWAALPPELRVRVRPVAAEDYWGRGKLRRWLAAEVFRAVLVARGSTKRADDPLGRMGAVLDKGNDLIVFPEGTRGDGEIASFRSGLFHLAQWGVLVCVYFLSYLPMLLYLPIEGFDGQQAKLLFFVVFVTQLSDVLQYVFGKWLGKHPVAPGVSPNKTWEGLIFGGTAATLAGGLLWWATPFTFWSSLAMAALLVAAGFLGGLVMSAVKRSLDTKDWGSGIPGHGGILDRLDSLLFAAPLFFHVTGYYFASNMALAYRQPDWMKHLLHLAPNW